MGRRNNKFFSLIIQAFFFRNVHLIINLRRMLTNIYEYFTLWKYFFGNCFSWLFFISSSPCELAIYYHFPLTEEETETQRMPLICPRSQLVSGSTASQILVVGNLTTGQSCHWHLGNWLWFTWTRKEALRAEWRGGDILQGPSPWSLTLRRAGAGQHSLLEQRAWYLPFLWEMTNNREDWAKSKYWKSLH